MMSDESPLLALHIRLHQVLGASQVDGSCDDGFMHMLLMQHMGRLPCAVVGHFHQFFFKSSPQLEVRNHRATKLKQLEFAD